MHLIFRFTPEAYSGTELKLKVEINTREHSNLLGLKKYPFAVDSGWYQGNTDLASFEPEELRLGVSRFRARSPNSECWRN
jgi:hypothetical protein